MISGNRSVYDVLMARKGFDFERTHDAVAFRQWAIKNSARVSWTIAIVYVIVIFSLQRFMRDRPKMNLRYIVALWNFLTAIFSIVATLRTLPYVFRMMSKYGAMYTICDESLYFDEVVSFWGTCFMLSKVPELIDTIFIVLRKQTLILLHWYHHASVVVFVFLSYPSWVGSGLFYMTMNYTVHSFMYSFYTLRALGYRFPRIVNIAITTMQIVQMILACWITGAVYYRMAIQGEACGSETLFQIYRTFTVYTTYFILFIHFFAATYLVPKKKQQPEIAKKEE